MSEIKYYVFIEEGEVNGYGCSPCINPSIISIEVNEEVCNNISTYGNYYYIYENNELIINPNYEQEQQAKEREEKDQMTLTPSDVERALLSARGWDFDDLKAFLKNEQGYTDLQIKAIGIELRANDFFRGATLKGTNIRIVDTIGALLGYTPEDMDYLFEHKELPSKNLD